MAGTSGQLSSYHGAKLSGQELNCPIAKGSNCPNQGTKLSHKESNCLKQGAKLSQARSRLVGAELLKLSCLGAELSGNHQNNCCVLGNTKYTNLEELEYHDFYSETCLERPC